MTIEGIVMVAAVDIHCRKLRVKLLFSLEKLHFSGEGEGHTEDEQSLLHWGCNIMYSKRKAVHINLIYLSVQTLQRCRLLYTLTARAFEILALKYISNLGSPHYCNECGNLVFEHYII